MTDSHDKSEPTIELDAETRANILKNVAAALESIPGPATHMQIHGAISGAILDTVGIIGGGLPGDTYVPPQGWAPPPGADPKAI